MKKNMGSTDRIVRLIAALLIGLLYFTGLISGTVAIILVVLGIVFIATSAISFCPIYRIFGINTCPTKEKK